MNRSVNRTSIPALPIQRQLWLLQRVVPEVGVANISARFEWHGPLDVLAFQQANGDFVARHPFLRTTVETCPDAGLIQIEHPPQAPLLTVHDIGHLSGQSQSRELEHLFRQAVETPIDEKVLPWIRVTVIRLAEQRFEIAFVFSHLICDGLSMGILCRELLESYQSRIAGRVPMWSHEVPSNLPLSVAAITGTADAIQAPDRDEDVERQLRLPYDHQPPKHPRYLGRRISVELNEIESQLINTISREHGCSPFVTWLTLVQILVFRYVDSNRFEIDIVTAGRTKELRRMVGPFFKTVGIETAIASTTTLGELLADNQRRVDRLNDGGIAVESSGKRSRLLLDYQAALRPVVFGDGVRVIPSEWDNGAAVAELCIGVRKHQQNYRIHFKYDIELFEPTTIDRMIGHLKTLLDCAARHPDRAIGELNFLPDVELAFLDSINQTKTPAPSMLVDQQFADQAARTPHDIALIAGDESLTYAQLLARAKRIELELRLSGVAAGERVAILLPRGSSVIAAMLGVLMRGACYVPIDLHAPVHRQRLVLDAARVNCIVCHVAGRARIPSELTAICVDELDAIEPAAAPTLENAARDVSDVAYLLFTSGSTGTPKGVEVTHANVSNFFVGVDEIADFANGGTWLAATSTSFDISVFELLWTLTRGFKVILCGHRDCTDGFPISQFDVLVSRHAVTHFQCTPALMRILAGDDANRSALGALKKIFVGGDRMSQPLADRLLELAGGEVYNMFGPTETTIWSTAWKLNKGEPVRIGRPLANQRVHLLDANLRPRPMGVNSELFIGGGGVANGYFNNPRETKQRFLEHPELGRLFRTGDVVRLLADGNLEFHGRSDQQVKLHGHRFELGDVEAAILSHTGVAQAVALLRGDEEQPLLTACIAGADDSLPTETALTDFLNHLLPPYMVPKSIARLSEFPVNGSGKVDRKAIAALTDQWPSSNSLARVPDHARVNDCSGRGSESPGDRLELKTASWNEQRLNQLRSSICEELNLDSLPEHGRWSDLAISSLDIVGLVVRLERDLKVRLNVADVFRDALIEQTLRTATGLEPAQVVNGNSHRAGSATSENVDTALFEEGVI